MSDLSPKTDAKQKLRLGRAAMYGFVVGVVVMLADQQFYSETIKQPSAMMVSEVASRVLVVALIFVLIAAGSNWAQSRR